MNGHDFHDAARRLREQQESAIEQAYIDAYVNTSYGLLVITDGAEINIDRDDTTITVTSRVGPHPSVPHGQIHYRSHP